MAHLELGHLLDNFSQFISAKEYCGWVVCQKSDRVWFRFDRNLKKTPWNGILQLIDFNGSTLELHGDMKYITEELLEQGTAFSYFVEDFGRVNNTANTLWSTHGSAFTLFRKCSCCWFRIVRTLFLLKENDKRTFDKLLTFVFLGSGTQENPAHIWVSWKRRPQVQ